LIPSQAQPSVQAPPWPLALALALRALPLQRAQPEPVELGLELSKREQPERAPLLAPLEPAPPQVPERSLPKVWPFAHCRRTRLQTPKPRRLPLGTMNYALF
jgi:hypothetical protein